MTSKTLTRPLALLVTPLLCALALQPMQAEAYTAGSGRSVSEQRNVAEFQAVSLSGSMDLVVRQGPQQQVQVQGDDNLLPLLETTVESGKQGPTLMVRWKRGESIRNKSPLLVTVVVPRLGGVSSAGSSDIKVEAFKTPSLRLSLSGSGDVHLDGLSTEDLGINISGSSDVQARGMATRLAVSIAGSGKVQLADLKSEEVSVSIAGSGDVDINANKTLDVRIAGSGSVNYTGNATLKSKVAGSGSVSRR